MRDTRLISQLRQSLVSNPIFKRTSLKCYEWFTKSNLLTNIHYNIWSVHILILTHLWQGIYGPWQNCATQIDRQKWEQNRRPSKFSPCSLWFYSKIKILAVGFFNIGYNPKVEYFSYDQNSAFEYKNMNFRFPRCAQFKTVHIIVRAWWREETIRSDFTTAMQCPVRLYEKSVANGLGRSPPKSCRRGFADIAEIKLYGDVSLRMTDATNFKGSFLPNFEDVKVADEKYALGKYGIERIDHIVGNVTTCRQPLRTSRTWRCVLRFYAFSNKCTH